MIPLRDDIESRTFPVVTVALIVVNSAVFLLEAFLGVDANSMVSSYGVVPAQLVSNWTNPLISVTLFTSMYLHGGWAHLIGNMLYLGIFGDNVEDRMGHVRFLIFYTLCGVEAGLLQVATAPTSEIPMIGASGAIAGVLGSYLLLYPRARVKALVPLFLFYRVIWLPAILVLGGWFLIQFLNGLATLSVTAQMGGTAWWAHIGGFAAGMILLPLFKQRNYQPPYGGYGRPTGYWVNQ